MKQVVLPIVILDFKLLEIQGEDFSGNAVIFYQPFLGEAPKALLPVYIDFTS